jgi:hypothetical protein
MGADFVNEFIDDFIDKINSRFGMFKSKEEQEKLRTVLGIFVTDGLDNNFLAFGYQVNDKKTEILMLEERIKSLKLEIKELSSLSIQVPYCKCGHEVKKHKNKFDNIVCDFCGCSNFQLINECEKCECFTSVRNAYDGDELEPNDCGWCNYPDKSDGNVGGDDYFCWGTPKMCPKITKKAGM